MRRSNPAIQTEPLHLLNGPENDPAIRHNGCQ